MNTERTEYMIEALIGQRGDESGAIWEPWSVPFSDTDDPFFQSRLDFVRKVTVPVGSDSDAPYRIYNYRVLKRTITTTEWEEVEIA
jgi:hypothetical protein